MRSLLPALILLVVSASKSPAELRGRIEGVVRDAEGTPLADVTVTASSSALIQPRVTRTGGRGAYGLAALPPGNYTLVFELSGYETSVEGGLRVQLGRILAIHPRLRLAPAQDGASLHPRPEVLARRAATGTTLTSELLREVPSARDLASVLARSPAFQPTAHDVGGSHVGTEIEYETYGYAGQNRLLLDGIQVTEGRGRSDGYFDYGSLEEVFVGGASSMAEHHGLGAFSNVIVRSGGEAVTGSAFLDYASEALSSDNVPAELARPGGVLDGFRAPPGGLARGNAVSEQYEIDLNLGGPIAPSRAWFFGGARLRERDQLVAGLPQESELRLVNLTAKATYALDARNQIQGFLNRRTRLRLRSGLSLARPLESSWWESSSYLPAKVEWTSALRPEALLELRASHFRHSFPLYPWGTQSASGQGVPAGRIDLESSQQQGAHSYYHERRTSKPQLGGSFSYFLDARGGRHDLELGVEAVRETRELFRFQPGNVYYRDRGGRPEEVDLYDPPGLARNETSLLAAYAQDAWSIGDRWTLNLGARFDRARLEWASSSRVTLSSIAPRIGLVYRVGDRTFLKGFWGRFASHPGAGIGESENPLGFAVRRYRFSDRNGNLLLDPGPDGSLGTSPELLELLSSSGGAGTIRVDPELGPEWGREISAHVEHALQNEIALRGSYVHKSFTNGWAEVDLARAFAYDVPFTFQDPGEDGVPGTADDRPIELFDRRAGVREDRLWTHPGRHGLPDHAGDYRTAEIALLKPYRDRWLLLSSYAFTWADDFRDTHSRTSALAAARQGPFYPWQPNRRRFGRQETSYWSFKLSAHHRFPYDIGLGAVYRLQSGFHVVRRIDLTLPNAGVEAIQAERLGSERTPSVGILDVRIEKALALGERARASWMVEVFNLLNADRVVSFRNVSGSQYRQVIALLDPRVVKIGFRVEL